MYDSGQVVPAPAESGGSVLLGGEGRYRLLLDNAPLGILLCSQSGGIVEVNRALLDILGSPSAAQTRAINILTFPPLVEAGISADLRRCMDENQPIRGEHPYRSIWGKETYLRYHLNPIRDALGAAVGVQAIVEDFTEYKRAEVALHAAHEALAAQAAELRDVNAELDQYASAVSHDLKAPLRAIHFYAEVLGEELGATLSAEHQTYLTGIVRAVRQAQALVEDLLQLSRIGTRAPSYELVDVRELLDRLIEALALPENVDVRFAGAWEPLQSDPGLLRQIFQNLILNGVKFNRSPRPAVELRCVCGSDGTVEFAVRDNGIGIDPAYHARIFRAFERLHSRSDYEGTGVGLALVRKAVTRLGGTVRLESAPGQGATFFVRLPFVARGCGPVFE